MQKPKHIATNVAGGKVGTNARAPVSESAPTAVVSEASGDFIPPPTREQLMAGSANPIGRLRTSLAATLLAVAGCSFSTSVTLYSFSDGSDGRNPHGGVIADAAGNFYGTTSAGGANDGGTVFQVTPSGTLNVLYSFAGVGDPVADGANPQAGLISDAAGNLYGTTYQGGVTSGCNSGLGCGTVFRVTPSRVETVLHRFTSDEGANPQAGLISDAAGNLYGTTTVGGATTSCNIPFGCGTVFQLTPARHLNVLHRFTGSDGTNPSAGLIADATGNLYGTTSAGGTGNAGTVFQLTPSGTLTVLHSFLDDGSEGATPYGGLIVDASGNLYGTTSAGAGTAGTVFELTAPSPTLPVWTLQRLHSFNSDGSEGTNPQTSLIADASGNLWGTTSEGGPNGAGTFFQLTPSGTLTVGYGFNGSDGRNPSGVIINAGGFFAGTTYEGGANKSGTVFQFPFGSISFTSLKQGRP
jgi:uncharacterized repeat protein (TIGR03803 family)